MVAVPARAQSAADDPTTDMARARFKEGVGFYDKGQFEQARASFLQAYALKKHPAVLLNLAWSCLKSGHTLEAEHYFKQFLAEGKDITDKQRADANDGLNQAHAKLGRIDVAAVAGTEVTVDGDKAGTTPLSDPILVEPGAHTVKFKGPDGATDTDSVTVLAGEKAIARFAKTAAAAPPAAAPTPARPAQHGHGGAAAAPAVRGSGPKPAEATHADEGDRVSQPEHLSRRPRRWRRSSSAGSSSVASFGLAIAMFVSKHSAQNKATDDGRPDRGARRHVLHRPPDAQHGVRTPDRRRCSSEITLACSEYQTTTSDVNTDATIGNIALGVGASRRSGRSSTGSSPTKRGDSPAAGSISPVLTPIVGRSEGGLSLRASF